MLTTRKKTGSPKIRERVLNEAITKYLMVYGRCAEWKDLKDAKTWYKWSQLTGEKTPWNEYKMSVEAEPIVDSVLKTAIDRLIDGGQIEVRADRRNNTTFIRYCLSKEVPVFWQDGKLVNLPEWASTVISDIEAALERDKQRPHKTENDTFEAFLERSWGEETNKVQAEAVAKALEMLIKEIAGLLKAYSQQPDDDSARQYLDPAIKIYLAVLIKEVARLVSPLYGSASTAINTALETLFKKERD